MSIFQFLPRNARSWASCLVVVVLLLIFYETFIHLDSIPRIQDVGVGNHGSKDTSKDTSKDAPDGAPKDGPVHIPDVEKSTKSLDCEVVNQMKNEQITVVMRTGATESYRKLPLQLLTTLRCFEPKDVLLYSDVEDEMGQFKITDILSTIPDSTKKANSDFDIYYEMQQYKANRQDFAEFPNELTPGHPENSKGWTLDKYKFLRVLEESYKQRPDSKWFVFVEADTYVFWSNLLSWLKDLDSSKVLYLGSVAAIGSTTFGHGGSGFIMSNPAIERLLNFEPGLVASWDELMKNECCGDFVIGMLTTKAGFKVKQAWPMLNGEYPESLEFGPDKSWCEPIVAMHHIPPMELTGVWEWEWEMQKHSKPILISDIYTQFVASAIAANPTRASWDNVSKDTTHKTENTDSVSELERNAYLSAENCEKACKAESTCFQYLWKSGTLGTDQAAKRDEEEDKQSSCTFSKIFKLGKFRADVQISADSVDQWISGWDTEKINRWVEENKCELPKWLNVD